MAILFSSSSQTGSGWCTDKTSQGIKRPKTKRPQTQVPGPKRPKRQNVLRTKRPKGQNVPRVVKTKTHCVRKLATYVRPHPCTQFMIGVFLLWGGQARPFHYPVPGHIELSNRPNICTVCQVMNSIYGEVRLGHSFFLGPIGLGNWPHFFGNGPLLSPWDVSSIGTFCSLRRPWDVLSLGRFVPWDVMSW